MELKPASSVLGPAGLSNPSLNVLTPNVDNYSAFLMQPRGNIDASAAGVRNRDRESARNQFGAFLVQARSTGADLVITPEYSMPWEVLSEKLKAGDTPEPGKLWVLGCESIKYSELAALKDELAPHVTVLYESFEADPNRFVDPLVYVFIAPASDGSGSRRVLLVQFKTHPMADADHFEVNGLQRGTCVYQFGGTAGQEIKLVSLICSDAFAFLDAQAMAVYDRALVIHIQLNPSPRHEQYRLYRDRLLRLHGDATELICLNWARNVQVWCNGQAEAWNNIAGSAWYLKPNEFDCRDETLRSGHRRGLYYTWLKLLRVHALFFNFQPAVYRITASKVAHIAVPAPGSQRRGPQLVQAYTWSDNSMDWAAQANAEDGFSLIVGEAGRAKDEVKRLSDDNPLIAERVLALCAGEIAHNERWHDVRQLDSCTIDASEIILRLTFCQDTHQRACDFRTARLRRCRHLWNALTTGNLPPALADLGNDVTFDWTPAFPHQNAVSSEGRRATVAYVGEAASRDKVEEVSKRLAEFLGRTFTEPDQIREARQRLVVWWRDEQDNIVPYDTHGYTQIDKTGEGSPFDIGREQ